SGHDRGDIDTTSPSPAGPYRHRNNLPTRSHQHPQPHELTIRVASRHKRRDDKKAAGRRLPPLDSAAMRAYRRPVTLAEQEAAAQETAAQRAATEQWDNEGGHCPDMPTRRPSTIRTTDTRRSTTSSGRATEQPADQVDAEATAVAERIAAIHRAHHQQLELWPRELPGPAAFAGPAAPPDR
ncbi:hypothetical protein OS965_40140, partial [Streptomyces sp. H27-G5]|nr:hypothetical protein [Streptomyces sp. H27-G5]